MDPNKKGIKVDKKSIKGEYVFSDVSFVYPSNKTEKILKKFSCTIEAGKTTALVGPSGSGKSTIIQLIERFYNPESGSITLDGVELDKYDLRQMRQIIGYVGQEPIMFNTTIR